MKREGMVLGCLLEKVVINKLMSCMTRTKPAEPMLFGRRKAPGQPKFKYIVYTERRSLLEDGQTVLECAKKVSPGALITISPMREQVEGHWGTSFSLIGITADLTALLYYRH